MASEQPRLRALLIEDNPGDARLIREMLADARGAPSIDIAHVDRLAAALEHLDGPGADVILLDLSLPDSHGLDTFLRVRAHAPAVPIVVLSGLDDETVAVRAVQEGAQDYLVKGHVDGDTLVRSLRYAVERMNLEKARQELERQRDELVASVSHDLRTPVAAIKVSIGVVLANVSSELPERLQRMLTNIDLAADELSRLVDDLLELARLKAGRVELYPTAIDLRELAVRSSRAVASLAEARGQQLVLALPSEPLIDVVDAERLERALLNLLGNANKYGREGGTIRLGLEQRGGEVVFAVADDGPGIPLADQERIFERFYRSRDEGALQEPGSGLGLPIARGLVELHGGRLWVESTPGRGSIFRIALPVDRQVAPDVA